MSSYNGQELRGRLFVVEGIDGSGKSTQLDLLHKWLMSQGYLVVFHRSSWRDVSGPSGWRRRLRGSGGTTCTLTNRLVS